MMNDISLITLPSNVIRTHKDAEEFLQSSTFKFFINKEIKNHPEGIILVLQIKKYIPETNRSMTQQARTRPPKKLQKSNLFERQALDVDQLKEKLKSEEPFPIKYIPPEKVPTDIHVPPPSISSSSSSFFIPDELMKNGGNLITILEDVIKKNQSKKPLIITDSSSSSSSSSPLPPPIQSCPIPPLSEIKIPEEVKIQTIIDQDISTLSRSKVSSYYLDYHDPDKQLGIAALFVECRCSSAIDKYDGKEGDQQHAQECKETTRKLHTAINRSVNPNLSKKPIPKRLHLYVLPGTTWREFLGYENWKEHLSKNNNDLSNKITKEWTECQKFTDPYLLDHYSSSHEANPDFKKRLMQIRDGPTASQLANSYWFATQNYSIENIIMSANINNERVE